MGDNPLYRITPMEKLIGQQPDVMINLSASPYNYAQDIVRNSIMKAHTLKYNIPMLYCNTVGSQTEIVFDGGSLVYDKAGNKVCEMKYFEEDYRVFELDDLMDKIQAAGVDSKESKVNKQLSKKSNHLSGGDTEPVVAIQLDDNKKDVVYFSATDVGVGEDTVKYLTNDKNMAEIYEVLRLGIRDYFNKMGFKKAILGSSGGVDSAVTQALAVAALGKENVRAVLMPSQYSTSHSVSDAEQLCRNLDNPFDIIPIKGIYDAFMKELQPVFTDLPFGIAEENIQSRSRGNLLMAIANKFGYILLNTSNKSELATGYGTLYGDMAGGLSVLGDVYKTQVFALARFINRDAEIIPVNIITKPPSAELRPGQRDSDSLPDYDILDRVLYEYIELRNGPKEIMAKGFDPALVARVLKLVNTNEYKRNQFCPIIRVSFKAFGVGRRVPIVGKYLS